MKFIQIDGHIEVYTNYFKPSCHFGNIIDTPDMGIVFYACGAEKTFTAFDLKKIADKIEEVQGGRNEKVT